MIGNFLMVGPPYGFRLAPAENKRVFVASACAQRGPSARAGAKRRLLILLVLEAALDVFPKQDDAERDDQGRPDQRPPVLRLRRLLELVRQGAVIAKLLDRERRDVL